MNKYTLVRNLKYTLFMFLLLVSVGIMQHMHNAVSIEKTKAICDKSHNEMNGSSEQACSDAQDATNTEYLCNSTGTSCWLEVK